jgi:hypothetical protein
VISALRRQKLLSVLDGSMHPVCLRFLWYVDHHVNAEGILSFLQRSRITGKELERFMQAHEYRVVSALKEVTNLVEKSDRVPNLKADFHGF